MCRILNRSGGTINHRLFAMVLVLAFCQFGFCRVSPGQETTTIDSAPVICEALTQSPQESSRVVPDRATSPEMSAADAAILEEIEQIRRRLGGGIAEELQGIREFSADDLMQQAAPQMQQTRNSLNADRNDPYGIRKIVPQDPDVLQAAYENHLRGLIRGSVDDVAPQQTGFDTRTVAWNDAEVGTRPSHASVVRVVARRLDQSAADLEDLGMYEMADELRDKAGILRRQVR